MKVLYVITVLLSLAFAAALWNAYRAQKEGEKKWRKALKKAEKSARRSSSPYPFH